MNMKKVLSLTSPQFSKQQLEELKDAVYQLEEGNERTIEWLVNDDGGLDLYVDEE